MATWVKKKIGRLIEQICLVVSPTTIQFTQRTKTAQKSHIYNVCNDNTLQTFDCKGTLVKEQSIVKGH